MSDVQPDVVVALAAVISGLTQIFKWLGIRGREVPKWAEQWLPRLVALLVCAAAVVSGLLPGAFPEQAVQGLASLALSLVGWVVARRAGIVKGEGERRKVQT